MQKVHKASMLAIQAGAVIPIARIYRLRFFYADIMLN